jgi:hypothetical protein
MSKQPPLPARPFLPPGRRQRLAAGCAKPGVFTAAAPSAAAACVGRIGHLVLSASAQASTRVLARTHRSGACIYPATGRQVAWKCAAGAAGLRAAAAVLWLPATVLRKLFFKHCLLGSEMSRQSSCPAGCGSVLQSFCGWTTEKASGVRQRGQSRQGRSMMR